MLIALVPATPLAAQDRDALEEPPLVLVARPLAGGAPLTGTLSAF